MAKSIFTIKKEQGDYTRSGSLRLNKTKIPTPAFMPVGTQGPIKGLTPDQVRSTGANIILGNAYHLHLRPGEKMVKKHGGLAEFSRWQGPTLTDSGGYQVFSLARVNKITDDGVKFQDPINGDEVYLTPEKSMQIQHDIGADIIMAFDDVVSLDKSGRARTLEAMDRTHRWLERSIAEHKKLSRGKKNPPLLFGIVQGGLDKRLRVRSLEVVGNADVDGVAIGGLSVGETRREMHTMLNYLAPLYDKTKPHYLMGVGHPIDMRYAIEHGIDMFDCVLPTRNARHGTVWLTGDKQILLRGAKYRNDMSVLDPGCDCDTCQAGYTKAYFHHLIRARETVVGTHLSIHNLRYVQRICEEYQA